MSPGFPHEKLSLDTSLLCSALLCSALLKLFHSLHAQSASFPDSLFCFSFCYNLYLEIIFIPPAYAVKSIHTEAWILCFLGIHLPNNLLLLSSMFYKVLKHEHHSGNFFVTIKMKMPFLPLTMHWSLFLFDASWKWPFCPRFYPHTDHNHFSSLWK